MLKRNLFIKLNNNSNLFHRRGTCSNIFFKIFKNNIKGNDIYKCYVAIKKMCQIFKTHYKNITFYHKIFNINCVIDILVNLYNFIKK